MAENVNMESKGTKKTAGIGSPTEAAVQNPDISSGRDLLGGATTTKRKLMR
jgi:hypothetical protein